MTDPGLCARCVHARIVVSSRGSRFWLCRAAEWHPKLRKYPALPVLRCPAFEPGTPDSPRSKPPTGL
jgi:hypothetical protein